MEQTSSDLSDTNSQGSTRADSDTLKDLDSIIGEKIQAAFNDLMKKTTIVAPNQTTIVAPNQSTIVETPRDVPEEDGQREIDRLLNSEEQGLSGDNDSDIEKGDDEVNAFEQLLNSLKHDDSLGEPVHNTVAEVVNSLWNKIASEERLKATLNKTKTPENCQLSAPPVNTSIWSSHMQPFQRQNDLFLQRILNYVMKTNLLLAVQSNHIFEAKNVIAKLSASLGKEKSPELNKAQSSINMALSGAIDALTILGHTSAEVNQKRRDEISKRLPSKYRGLSKDVDKDSKNLFGDNLTERIKITKDNSMLINPDSKNWQGKYSNGKRKFNQYHQSSSKRSKMDHQRYNYNNNNNSNYNKKKHSKNFSNNHSNFSNSHNNFNNNKQNNSSNFNNTNTY